MLDISEYKGRTAVLTGAASGMGLYASQALCADAASFVTGTNHIVDGGRHCMYQPYVAPKA